MLVKRNWSAGSGWTFLLLILAVHGAVYSPAAQAQSPMVPSPPSIAASSYLLIDMDTEYVLSEQGGHTPLPPASLTKIMTSYVAAQELNSGRINLDDAVPISVKAWRTPGSRMFIREGTTVSVRDLLKGVIIQSGNDASVAIAEHIAGSEDAFADMMNQTAQTLGMTGSQFVNATGLPDENHYTTAQDLAVLTRALIRNFPQTYAVYAERSFRYNDIEQPNRNRLLWRDKSVDGVKTGHTEEAGYCLVASAERKNMRLISVVMGADSEESRMRESQKLMSYGFRYFETQKLYDANVMLKNNEIYYGEAESVALGVEQDVYVTVPRGHYDNLKAEMEVPVVLEAPVSVGETVGELVVSLNGDTLHSAPLVSLAEVGEAGIFSRISDFIYLFFAELFG